MQNIASSAQAAAQAAAQTAAQNSTQGVTQAAPLQTESQLTQKASHHGQILLVPTRVLLLIAASAWLIAGVNVVIVGLDATTVAWTWPMAVGFLLTFTVFFVIFMIVSQQNARRVFDCQKPLSFILQFFDARSYIIMAVMLFLGAAVRISTFVPDPIIAFFYGGLGFALIFAGLYLVILYIQNWKGSHFDN